MVTEQRQQSLRWPSYCASRSLFGNLIPRPSSLVSLFPISRIARLALYISPITSTHITRSVRNDTQGPVSHLRNLLSCTSKSASPHTSQVPSHSDASDGPTSSCRCAPSLHTPLTLSWSIDTRLYRRTGLLFQLARAGLREINDDGRGERGRLEKEGLGDDLYTYELCHLNVTPHVHLEDSHCRHLPLLARLLCFVEAQVSVGRSAPHDSSGAKAVYLPAARAKCIAITEGVLAPTTALPLGVSSPVRSGSADQTFGCIPAARDFGPSPCASSWSRMLLFRRP